ncbi:hypothetical protein RND81_05G128700 [Saponaria officinalis]|uniref:DUF4005 domain-containing protein n=1 Tax=Saponaria officinalis TaxID=3572 RepID=A0AAW1L0J6_SAPOF
MGKKGSWFSAIKRVFTHSSKDKGADGTEKKSSKEKKKKGFRPLFREPSSIEKILGEAEREHLVRNHRPPTPPERSKLPPHVTPLVRNATLLWDDDSSRAADSPPRDPSPPRVASPPRNVVQSTTPLADAARPSPPRVATPPPPPPPRRAAPPPRGATPVNEVTPARAPSPRGVRPRRPEPTLKNQHVSATKIQTAYRGYMARRSYRALRGLVRLQGVVKGQSVKRQTANTLKCMQMLVRVQTQIQARRVQMLENQAPQRQALSKNEKDLETAFGKWLSENQEDWDDSTLTKEEIEARMQRKFDAIVKRERALAYAYSHQSWKSTPRIGHGALADFRTGGYPYWWNWLEQRQPQPSMTTLATTNVPKSPFTKNFHLTPTRPTTNFKASPFPHSTNTNRLSLGFENMDNSTPKSTRSSIPPRTRQAMTPPPGRRLSRGSAATSPFNNAAFRDDDSLTSCPPFSGPRYMSPTASAQAKLKAGKEPFPDSPGSITSDVSKRRVSYPLGGQGTGSFKWSKGSFFSNKETSSQRGVGKIQTAQSVGNLSIDSSTSMPASVGKKPFNRFV